MYNDKIRKTTLFSLRSLKKKHKTRNPRRTQPKEKRKEKEIVWKINKSVALDTALENIYQGVNELKMIIHF